MQLISPPSVFVPIYNSKQDLYRLLEDGEDICDSWGVQHSYQNSFNLRLESFQSAYTYPRIRQQPEEFAKNYFRYCGVSDETTCVFCKVVIGCWDPEDDILECHKLVSPSCPAVKRFSQQQTAADISIQIE